MLIVDDNATFVESLVEAFELHGFEVVGCSEPWRVTQWRKSEQIGFDLMLLDMRLGFSPQRRPIHATDLIPHLMTYSPAAKIVVISQEDISVEECVGCIRRGAVTVLPKTVSINELVLVADVHRVIGDQGQTREELIQVLWEDVAQAKDGGDGRRLELLTINLFNSIPTCEVRAERLRTSIGEIDVLVENVSTHPFWQALASVHLVVECKHVAMRSPTKTFTHLQELVKTRGRMSRVGILVSVAGSTRGFKKLQSERKDEHGIHIFSLDRDNLAEMVATEPDARDECLRRILGSQ